MLAPDRDAHHIPVSHRPLSACTYCATGGGGTAETDDSCVRLP